MPPKKTVKAKAPLTRRRVVRRRTTRAGHRSTGMRAKRYVKRKVGTRGLKLNRTRVTRAIEDVRRIKLRFTFNNAFSVAGGNVTWALFKLNTPYQPDNSASAGGYQEAFLQFSRMLCRGSAIKIRVWADTAGDQEPFRLLVAPTTAAQAGTYAAYSNLSSAMNNPHSKYVIYSPGDKLPTLRHYAEAAQVFSAEKHIDYKTSQMYSAGLNANPGNLVYWTVGYQSMGGTTTQNIQIQVQIDFYCEYYNYIPVQAQFLSPRPTPPPLDKWGNDAIDEKGTSGCTNQFIHTTESLVKYLKSQHIESKIDSQESKLPLPEEKKVSEPIKVTEPEYELVKVPLRRSLK